MPALVWRTPLASTAQYWEGWYAGLSQLFLACRAPKLLLLADTDRLDRDLMVAQMQVCRHYISLGNVVCKLMISLSAAAGQVSDGPHPQCWARGPRRRTTGSGEGGAGLSASLQQQGGRAHNISRFNNNINPFDRGDKLVALEEECVAPPPTTTTPLAKQRRPSIARSNKKHRTTIAAVRNRADDE